MYRSVRRPAQPPHGHTKAVLRSALLVAAILLASAACARPPASEVLWAVGQTAKVDGWLVTVHSFSVLPADEWRQPATGHIFCAVELTLENSSGQIRYVMPEKQMLLIDRVGRSYALDRDAGVIAARSRQWLVPEGEFHGGEEAHGSVTYQIPDGSDKLHWAFRSSLWPWARSVTFGLENPQQP
jgi:hypothetical protein